MAENDKLAAPAKTAAKSAAAPKIEEKKTTLTLTFEGKDLDLHSRIVADAEEDERTPSLNVLRFLRTHYGKAVPAGAPPQSA